MADAGTISSMVPFLVAAAARMEGADAAALLTGSGLVADAPPRPDEHVPFGAYLVVWRRALARDMKLRRCHSDPP